MAGISAPIVPASLEARYRHLGFALRHGPG
jgi:hypothetical protein